MARRIPSLNWLRVFEAAARTGSFARAAEWLAMSPPAVSQQIRSLEEHLGRALFDREAAGVRLTEAGRQLFVVVGETIGRMEEAADALSHPKGPPLVVGVSATLLSGWLAPRFHRFAEHHPDVTVQLHSLIGRPEAPPRAADLWIAFGQPPPGTQSAMLVGEHLVPVAPLEIAKTLQNLDDLKHHPLIEVADHRRNWAQVLRRDVVPDSQRLVHVDTTLAALSLASLGSGIALARPPATDALVAQFGLVPCLNDFAVAGVEAYHVLHDLGRALSPAAAAFRAWIISEVDRQDGG